METLQELPGITLGRPIPPADTPNSIRFYRRRAKLSQEDLAARIGRCYQTVLRWEKTGKGLRYTEQYEPIAAVLGCSIEDLKRPQKILA